MSEEHVEEIAQLLSKARYGPGLDMGGAHNPTPSESKTARRFVEDAIAPLETARDRLAELALWFWNNWIPEEIDGEVAPMPDHLNDLLAELEGEKT